MTTMDAEDVTRKLYDELKDQTRMVQSTRQLLTDLAARRRETVAELNRRGQTYVQIAEKLGISKSGVQQILKNMVVHPRSRNGLSETTP
ncbi:MAG: hypothetical protein E6R04_06765 [Spirochaetes bacterium]|nr:MAG: hypothetical protein E6R04_06765 [Spirochaetota bacterium]